MNKTAIFTDAVFKEHDPGFDQVESPTRITTLLSGVDSYCSNEIFVKPHFLKSSQDTLLLVHTRAHIEKIESTSGKIFSVLDEDTFTSAKSFDAACAAAGAVVKGVDLLFSGDIANGFALVRPPGHHAEKNGPMGYCLFNNIAIGARHAIQNLGFSRILIFDWDLHHGNGTQNIFYDTDEVLYISIHQSPAYPGTGNLTDTGKGKGEGYSINIPFPGGQGDTEYANTLNTVIRPIVYQYKPELILVSAGFDASRDDAIGNMYVTYQGFGYMACTLKEMATDLCGGKILFVLEGGYNLADLEQGVFTVLTELAGVKLDTPFSSNLDEAVREKLRAVDSPHPAIEPVRDIAKKYWKM